MSDDTETVVYYEGRQYLSAREVAKELAAEWEAAGLWDTWRAERAAQASGTSTPAIGCPQG